METITEEIQRWFATGTSNSAYQISSAGQEYKAFVIKTSDEFGVAVPYNGKTVNEDFAHARMFSDYRKIGAVTGDYLFLVSDVTQTRNEFASICENFVNPGLNGNARKELIADPSAWWKRWKTVIGNKNSEKRPYSILGEMLIYMYLKKAGKNPVWSGPVFKTHDIQTTNADYEVKSSLRHHNRVVEINGEFQLSEGKPLYLCYCRFEENVSGICIDDIVRKLADDGDDEGEINRLLALQGYRVGNSSRKVKYQLLESLEYTVDDQFPCIKPEVFKGNKYPEGVSNISYSLSLDNLPRSVIDIDLRND